MFSFFDISSSLWQTFIISFLSLLNPWNIIEDDTKKKTSEYEKVQNKLEIKLKHDENELNFYENNSTCSTCKHFT